MVFEFNILPLCLFCINSVILRLNLHHCKLKLVMMEQSKIVNHNVHVGAGVFLLCNPEL